jgi:phosphate transport system permease protein
MPDFSSVRRRIFAPQARDGALRMAIWAAAGILFACAAWLMLDVAVRGAAGLDWRFLVDEPARAGRAGGIGPILVSTGLILAVAIAVAAPLGLAAAIFLAEFLPSGSRFAAWTSISLDVLAGIPSIVFGLFGNAFFSVWLGMGFSILSGGLTLACMILPLLIRTAEHGLRMVPDEWRHGAAALGMSRFSSVWRIVLPAAGPAVTAGLLLGLGRATAETAALVFTSGYVDRMPSSLLDSGRALSLHIYDLAMNVAGGDRNAYASALVLLLFLIVVNGLAMSFSDYLLRKRIAA